MKKEELEVYSEKTNQSVVRMPGRKFPGLVLQGDSLCSVFWRAMAVLEELESGDLEHARLDALDVARALEADVLHYEKVLSEHGIDLPYDRDPDRNTGKYEHFRAQPGTPGDGSTRA